MSYFGHRAFSPALALFLLCLGYGLNPVPSDPDKFFSFVAYLGTLSLFIFWSISIFSWGRILTRIFRLPGDEWAVSATVGSAAAACTAGLLGHLGLIGIAWRGLQLGLLLLGPALTLCVPQTQVKRTWRLRIDPSRAVADLLLLGVVAVVLHRAWITLHLQFHSDPLFYDLTGPRLWVQRGKIFFPSQDSALMQCSYWDYLYIWAQMLLAGEKEGGLIEAHYFSQWTHFVFGFVATVFFVDRILRRLNAAELWRRTGLFAATVCSMVGWSAWMAKNDFGAIVWCLAGLELLAEWPLAAGIFWGLALGAKASSLFFILSAGLLGIIEYRKNGKSAIQLVQAAAKTILGSVLALSPILFRNFIWLGNPFFPQGGKFFKSSWLTHSAALLQQRTALHGWPEFWILLGRRFEILVHRELLFITLAPLLLYALFRQRPLWSTQAQRLGLALLLGCCFFLSTVGPPPAAIDDGTLHLRYLGAILVLGVGVAAAVIGEALADAKVAIHYQLVLVLIFVSVHVYALPISSASLTSENEADAVRSQARGGQTKAWIRMNIDAKHLVVSLGDNQLYYLSDHNLAVLPYLPGADSLMYAIGDSYTFASCLRALGIDYVLDTQAIEGIYWTQASRHFVQIARDHPEAIAYQAQESYVFNLAKLSDKRLGPCPADIQAIKADWGVTN